VVSGCVADFLPSLVLCPPTLVAYAAALPSASAVRDKCSNTMDGGINSKTTRLPRAVYGADAAGTGSRSRVHAREIE
jgi:hypothetical protein